MLCPCESQKFYAVCCEPFILGKAQTQTPEQLMRSRYTAYTQANTNYIGSTMSGKAAQGFDRESTGAWALRVQWHGLEVIKAPKPQDNYGLVEFIASYEEEGVLHKIREFSEFERLDADSSWYYTGQILKIERNAKCPCGSGKKYKKCCAL